MSLFIFFYTSWVKNNYIVKIYRLKCPSESNYPTVNTTPITNKLNQIYSVVGASFTVSTITHDLAFNLDTNSNGYYDNYDNLESRLLSQTMNSLSVQGEISVFVLNDKIQSKTSSGTIVNANGFAPLNSKFPASLSKPYVVLTAQNTTIPETLAHEIGHCVFGFQHPFDEFSAKGQIKGQDPNNIMDYSRASGYCGLRAYQVLIINQYDILRLWIDR